MTTLICTPSKKLYSFFWAFSLATSHGKEEAPASSTGTPASLSLLIPAHCAKLPSGMVYFQAKFNDIVAKLKCTHLQPHKRLLQTPGEGDVEVKACLGKASSSSGMLLMLGWRDNEASWKEQSYYHCSKYGKMNPCRCPIQYCHLPTIPTNIKLPPPSPQAHINQTTQHPEISQYFLVLCHYLFLSPPPPLFFQY